MNNKSDIEQEFEGFEASQDSFEQSGFEQGGFEAEGFDEAYLGEENQIFDDAQIDDAEFQDLDILDDSDVFDDGEPVVAGPAKKGPNWFNIGVAAVAVLVAGGLVLAKILPNIGGGADNNVYTANAPVNPEGVKPQDTQAGEAAVQAAVSPQNTGLPKGGMLDNPDAFADLMNSAAPSAEAEAHLTAGDDPFSALMQTREAEVIETVAELPMPSPISTQDDSAEEVVVSGALPAVNAAQDDFWSGFGVAAEGAAGQAQNVQQTGNALGEIADKQASAAQNDDILPSADTPNMQAEMGVAKTPVLQPQSEVQAPVLVDAQQDDALRAQVSALDMRLKSLENKVDTAMSMVQTQTANAAVGVQQADDKRLDRIQTALERLESRLDDIAKAPRTQAASTQPAAKAPSAQPIAKAQTAVVDTAPVNKAPVSKTSPAPRSASSVPARQTQRASVGANTGTEGAYKPNVTQASSWRLRGAQPGMAIIAQANGNVREVRAGDFVPGIGQITGVATVNGKWVVQGTQGRISQ